MPRLRQGGCGLPNGLIIGSGISDVQHRWRHAAPRWKRARQLDSPAVDGHQAVGLRRDTELLQACSQGDDACNRVRQYQDRLIGVVTEQVVGDQVCFSAPGGCSD